MMTTLIILALIGSFVLGVFASEIDSGIICRPKKETAADRVKQYGYDPCSSQVQKFQTLAGIRSNRGRFNLRNM